jgi:GT2 family glycosyltransferase/glycosyltransferase involved in cell wall biosynthesis
MKSAEPTRPPLVSVIVANYNGAAYLGDSLRSALAQNLTDLEIIVSDDASSDGSTAIVRRLMAEDGRIRLITSDVRRGPAAARNSALASARGKWLAVLDSDDMMHPARLETLTDLAEQDSADIVADDLLVFDSDHVAPPKPLLRGKFARTPFSIDIPTYIRLSHLYGTGPSLGYLKPVIRARLLKGISYDERLRIGEDYHLILRLLLAGARYRVYPLLYYFYRKHPSSVSHRLDTVALSALRAADAALIDDGSYGDQWLVGAARARLRSIDAASAFEGLLDALRMKDYVSALRTMARHPRTIRLLKFPIGARLSRLFAVQPASSPSTRQVCVISRQRVVGRTNGSSVYLLELVGALARRGLDVHFLSPSPATLGRWPYLLPSDELSVFESYRVRGTWRFGRCLVSTDPSRAVRAAFAILDKILVNSGILASPMSSRAPYSVAQPLTREDQLFIARHAPRCSDFLIADYCFLTEALPYALRPDAQSAVIMHDLFSSRASQFDALKSKDSVALLSEDEECEKLAAADCILAIQADEAAVVKAHLPDHHVMVVRMAAKPVAEPAPGDDDTVLFVGSDAAPNVDGVRWFIERCWPLIRAQRPNALFHVAGTVSQTFGPPPEGVFYLGHVHDLGPLYNRAGVVVSPLRVGSGLKIKLIQALELGKAVVATSATLQGVADRLTDAIHWADESEAFAAAVVSLMNDAKTRISLAKRSLDTLARHFSPDQSYGPFVEYVYRTSTPPRTAKTALSRQLVGPHAR